MRDHSCVNTKRNNANKQKKKIKHRLLFFHMFTQSDCLPTALNFWLWVEKIAEKYVGFSYHQNINMRNGFFDRFFHLHNGKFLRKIEYNAMHRASFKQMRQHKNVSETRPPRNSKYFYFPFGIVIKYSVFLGITLALYRRAKYQCLLLHIMI